MDQSTLNLVHYTEVAGNREYTVHDLADALRNERKILLLGNYGTGKSRCVQEVFNKISEISADHGLYPLASSCP